MKKTLYGIYIILAISLSTFLFTQDAALYANPKKQSSNALDSQTLFDIFHDIATLNWDIHLISLGDAKSFNRKELLLDKKNTLLESLPSLLEQKMLKILHKKLNELSLLKFKTE